MMGLRSALTVLALDGMLAGCGGGDDSDPQSIVGTWGLEMGTTCAFATNFDTGGQWSGALVCTLEGNVFGAEVQGGTYAVSGKTLTKTTLRASCPNAARTTEVANFAVDGDHLTVTNNSGAVVFERVPEGEGSGMMLTGCWDNAMQVFTQNDLHAL
jgi:hypothetical protein